MRRYLPFVIIAVVLVVAVGAGLTLYRYRMEPEASPTPPPSPTVGLSPTAAATPTQSAAPIITATPAAQQPAPVGPVFTYGRPGAEPAHVRGEAGAAVVLEEFGDFQCLPCSVMWPILQRLEGDYEKRLVVVFREHPLKMHRFAADAARAAEAAGLQGKFWEMHDALYRNRLQWVPATYVRPLLNDYATELGLDLERFKADIDGDEVNRRMAADWDRGESLGIDSTPVVFINGTKVPVPDLNEKGLRAAIDKILAPTP